MRAYSEDLRHRVVQACDEGLLTRQEIADQFHISTAWIRRLLQRRRESGSISALPGGRGPKPKLTEAQLRRLSKLVEKQPDSTLAELRKRARLSCCLSTVHRALKSLGLSFKKSRYELVNKTVKMYSKHASPGLIA
ncbi:MAG: helix-turn-helix domain-containing protein [Pirellulales bacterium]